MGVVGARHTHPRLKGPNFPGQRLAFLLSDFQEDVMLVLRWLTRGSRILSVQQHAD